MLDYGLHEWRTLLQELKDLGIDTIILDAAARLDRHESYYPSRLFGEYNQRNVLAPFLHAAAHEDLAVFLGGAAGQVKAVNRSALDTRLECFRELCAYRQDFHGFYVDVPECYSSEPFDHTPVLNEWLVKLCSGMRNLAPEMPILLAPPIGDLSFDTLNSIYHDLPVDILAPRDSIGTGLTSLHRLQENLDNWKNLSSSLGTELWVTVEPFEQFPTVQADQIHSAEFAASTDSA